MTVDSEPTDITMVLLTCQAETDASEEQGQGSRTLMSGSSAFAEDCVSCLGHVVPWVWLRLGFAALPSKSLTCCGMGVESDVKKVLEQQKPWNVYTSIK